MKQYSVETWFGGGIVVWLLVVQCFTLVPCLALFFFTFQKKKFFHRWDLVCLSFPPFHKKPPFKCVCYFTSILDPFSYTLCAKNHIVFLPSLFFNLIFWFGQLFSADFASFFVHRHKRYFIFRKERHPLQPYKF